MFEILTQSQAGRSPKHKQIYNTENTHKTSKHQKPPNTKTIYIRQKHSQLNKCASDNTQISNTKTLLDTNIFLTLNLNVITFCNTKNVLNIQKLKAGYLFLFIHGLHTKSLHTDNGIITKNIFKQLLNRSYIIQVMFSQSCSSSGS